MDCGILQEFRQETFQAGPLGFPLPLSLLLTPRPLLQPLPDPAMVLGSSRMLKTI